MDRPWVLPACSSQEAVLILTYTKGTKNIFLPLDKMVLQEKLALQALQHLCYKMQPGDSLSQMITINFVTFPLRF